MKTISLKDIQKLNPCKDRLDNYTEHYNDRKFTPRQFMGLKHITHSDKLWVVLRFLPKKDLFCAAADFAESVLSIYETKYPNDTRPREAIRVLRLYANEEATLEQVRNAANAAYADAAYAYADAADAAYAAAYAADAADAADTAAYAAAYAADAAASYAAAYAAYAADAAAYAADAADAAAYAAYAAAYAADAAAYAADAADTASKLKQQKLCRTILLRYWKG